MNVILSLVIALIGALTTAAIRPWDGVWDPGSPKGGPAADAAVAARRWRLVVVIYSVGLVVIGLGLGLLLGALTHLV